MNNKRINDKFNIMIIGDVNVGKTTILERYINNKKSLEETFLINKKPTLGKSLLY